MVALFALVFFGILSSVTLIIGVGIYRGLLTSKRQIDKQWSEIEKSLNEKHSELPDLLSTLEKKVSFEKAIIEKVKEVKSRFDSTPQLVDKIKISNEMSNVLSSVWALGEAHPQLKNDSVYIQSKKRIKKVEADSAKNIDDFNDKVFNFNFIVEQFPDMFFAQAMGYQKLDLLLSIEEKQIEIPYEPKVAA
jgi:LemA protein